MKKILKPSYSAAKFKSDGLIYGGEMYVCDNLQDIVVQVVLTDVTDGVENHMGALKDVVDDYIKYMTEEHE